MAEVVSFESYVPPVRYDAVPWTTVRIEEAPASTGPWTVIDTFSIGTADPDPSDPQARSFTTSLGTAPDLWYRVSFLDGGGNISEPTSAARNGGLSTLYVSRDELKDTLELAGTYADADIDLACEAASRAVDGYTDSRFYPTTETRYYTACVYDTHISIDDAVSVSSVAVDTDGNGSYDQTWVEDTDFYLDPPNSALVGHPKRRIELRSQAGRTFPSYTRGIKVVGSFGWAETPAQVRQAARILASRFLKRSRETPYGIQVVTGDAVALARLGRIDPDVAFLLDTLPGKRTVLFV
jgi:hypothetical protein